jgi:hypothetical protein
MSIAVRLFSVLANKLSAVVAPTEIDSVTDYESFPFAAVTAENATCTVTGGASPIAYLWVRVSGDTQITPSVEDSSFTSFGATFPIDGASFTTVFRCDVTDANGLTASSNTVTVTMTGNLTGTPP